MSGTGSGGGLGCRGWKGREEEDGGGKRSHKLGTLIQVRKCKSLMFNNILEGVYQQLPQRRSHSQSQHQ